MPNRRSAADSEAEPFANAEEAWFWYAQCQMARNDGARFTAGLGAVSRPCEPDDIMREVSRLYRSRRLRRSHLGVLNRFGQRMAPPDPNQLDSRTDAGLWDEALDRLTTPLKQKGIVA
jgi:hypothetical protein